MGPEEIHSLMVKSLHYDEFEWQAGARIPFKGKNLAESIEKLLYYCPECHRFNTMISKGDHFHCTSCDETFVYDEYGTISRLEGDIYEYQLPQWNNLQRSRLKEKLEQGINIEGFPLDMERLKVSVGKKSLTGIWTVTPYELRNKEDGAHIRFDEVKNYSITFNRVIKFTFDKLDYKLELPDGCRLSVKFLYDCMCLLKED